MIKFTISYLFSRIGLMVLKMRPFLLSCIWCLEVLFIGVQDFVRVYMSRTHSPLWIFCDLLGKAKVRRSVGRILRDGRIQVRPLT
jgi:hypothetical protein